MLTICVLLWKHFLVRKRRFVHSILQLLSVVMILFNCYYLNNKLMNEAREDFRVNTTKPRIARFDEVEPSTSPLRVLYSPRTRAADALMDGAGAWLGLSRLDHLPGENEKGYASFSRDDELKRFLRKMHRSDAIVLFKNDVYDGLPSNLEYTIRMKMDYDPGIEVQPLSADEQRRTDVSNAVFVNVQWAVDRSYLQLLTGTKINQRLNLVKKKKVKTDFVAPYLIWVATAGCTLSHSMVFLHLVCSLMDEKNPGIQDLLKILNIPVILVILSHALNALPAGLVYSLGGAGLLKAGELAIFMHTSYGTLAGILFLHYCAVMATGIFVASIITTTQRRTSIVFMIYFGLAAIGYEFCGRRLVDDHKQKVWGAVPPHGGLWLFMTEAAQLEKYDEPSTKVAVPVAIMLGHTCVFMLLAIIFFSLLQRGSCSCSFGFLTRLFKKNRGPKTAEKMKVLGLDPAYFEELPDRPVGIEIIEVTKEYSDKLVLDNITLDVLEGEITVLLGHNGSGKTTLMNIIIGMVQAGSGEVLVNGYSTSTEMGAVRNLLGVCPQHNYYFTDLTVSQHYRIFAMLKGVSFGKSKKACTEVLKKMNLAGKSNKLVSTLSGGMQRRVQLACALAGDASVLILDEPTSGLDVESRREIWDILLQLRGGRTVLMTTHLMEEADMLGDRVAAMHKGQIKCFGTPIFLKRAIGSGYRLTLSTAAGLDERALTGLVRRTVPATSVVNRAHNSITYNLPARNSLQLPQLFQTLEGARGSLGIETMSVSQSSLDDVFMKLCTDENIKQCNTWEIQGPRKEYAKLFFITRYMWQFLALLKRQALYVWSKKVSFFLMQLIIPLLFITYMSYRVRAWPAKIKNSTQLYSVGLDAYQDQIAPARVMYDDEPDNSMPVMRSGYKGVQFDSVQQFTEDMFATDDFRVGIHINRTHATAMYTDAGPLAAPAAVNVLANTLASRLIGNPRALRLTAYNDPEQQNTYGLVPPKHKTVTRVYCVSITFLALVHLSGYVAMTSAERASGTRHMLLMAGCPLPLIWLTALATQVLSTLLMVALPSCLLAYAFDTNDTFKHLNFVGVFFLLLTMSVLANSSFNNVIGLCFSGEAAPNVTVLVAFGIGLVLGSFDRLILEDNYTGTTFYMFIEAMFSTMPPQVAIEGALQVARAAVANSWCYNNKHLCPEWYTKDELSDERRCCNVSGFPTQDYFSIDSKGVGGELIFLAMQFGGYTVLLLFLDSRITSRMFGTKAFPVKTRFTDPAIEAEKRYVEKMIKMKTARKKKIDNVLAYDLCKRYVARGGFFAVKGVSFSVKQGECMGILGVNGSGKSTVFKMLSALENPSHGKLYSSGYFFTWRYWYMSTLAYCAQFQTLDTFLTGRQNLELVMTMRGFDRQIVSEETEAWLEEFGLTEYADKRLSTYSGGCSRRLAAAAALCQRAPTTLLDEPTAGVDPVARRCVQAAILRVKREHRSIIISSHSIDEMELLCERMVLLSGGLVATLGPAARLRCRYGKGYFVTFKIFAAKIPDPEDEPTATYASGQQTPGPQGPENLGEDNSTLLQRPPRSETLDESVRRLSEAKPSIRDESSDRCCGRDAAAAGLNAQGRASDQESKGRASDQGSKGRVSDGKGADGGSSDLCTCEQAPEMHRMNKPIPNKKDVGDASSDLCTCEQAPEMHRLDEPNKGEVGDATQDCDEEGDQDEMDAEMLSMLGSIDVNADAEPNEKGMKTLDVEMHRRFDCDVIDDRKVMIQYRINKMMPYSELFTQMEQVKRMFPKLIEDYSVTDTTLEEVFLYFAKEALEFKKKWKQVKKKKKREPFFKKWCGGGSKKMPKRKHV